MLNHSVSACIFSILFITRLELLKLEWYLIWFDLLLTGHSGQSEGVGKSAEQVNWNELFIPRFVIAFVSPLVNI